MNLQKMKKNKKGFTLIEIIVVLIIIAILAAALIPSMLTFVDEAKGKALGAEARVVYVAAQTVATEEYATGNTTLTTMTQADAATAPGGRVKALAEVVTTGPHAATFTVTVAAGKVTQVVYTKDAHTITLDPVAGTTTIS